MESGKWSCVSPHRQRYGRPEPATKDALQRARSPAGGAFEWVRHNPGDDDAKEGAPFLAQCLEAARDQVALDLDRKAAETVDRAATRPPAVVDLLASNLLNPNQTDR